MTVEKTRRYVNDISDDNLADFIDTFAKMVLIDYTKLDFPSLLVYLCQRRGTRKYIGDMFEVSQTLICRVLSLKSKLGSEALDICNLLSFIQPMQYSLYV